MKIERDRWLRCHRCGGDLHESEAVRLQTTSLQQGRYVCEECAVAMGITEPSNLLYWALMVMLLIPAAWAIYGYTVVVLSWKP